MKGAVDGVGPKGHRAAAPHQKAEAELEPATFVGRSPPLPKGEWVPGGPQTF